MNEKIGKESWKKFLKIIIPTMIINILLVALIYFISPEQIPKSMSSSGAIETYQNRRVLFYLIYLQLGAILFGILGYFLAFIYKIYPNFWKQFVLKWNSLFLGKDIIEEPFILVIRKYILSFVLTFSIILFIVTLFMFLMFNLPNLTSILTISLIVTVLIGGFLCIRFFINY